jgi:hypothetical protein
MVVVHRAFGFRFVTYTFDHEPAHVQGRLKTTFGAPTVILKP